MISRPRMTASIQEGGTSSWDAFTHQAGEYYDQITNAIGASATKYFGEKTSFGEGAKMLTGKSSVGMAWLELGRQGLDQYLQNQGIRKQAEIDAAHQRRLGEMSLKQAERHSRDVIEGERFKSSEEVRNIRNQGFLTGSKSIQTGGVSSIVQANKTAAQRLSDDIMNQARLQAEEYEKVAKGIEDVADQRRKANYLGRFVKGTKNEVNKLTKFVGIKL